MVRINLHSFPFEKHLDYILAWLDLNIAMRTVCNQNPDDSLTSDVVDHHFYTGAPGWQYHYVMTTLVPADSDRDLYTCVFEASASKTAVLHYVAMYIEFENDAEAVMFKLVMSGN
jgi:hypothetical protein